MVLFKLCLFPLRGDFCRLLITFANSLDPDQARQNVGPDLDLNCLTVMVFLKEPASVAQLDAPPDWRPGGRGFNPRRGRQHSFLAIDR